MRVPLIALTLLFALTACAPKEEGTPLPTRTEKTSEGGFGGLNKQKQQKVPEKPPQYDLKAFPSFGLTPYPKLTGDNTATTESQSTQDTTNFIVEFHTLDPVETVSAFYAPQLDGGNATPKTVGETTVIEGISSTKAQVTIIISLKESYTNVTINATKITQYEAK